MGVNGWSCLPTSRILSNVGQMSETKYNVTGRQDTVSQGVTQISRPVTRYNVPKGYQATGWQDNMSRGVKISGITQGVTDIKTLNVNLITER